MYWFYLFIYSYFYMCNENTKCSNPKNLCGIQGKTLLPTLFVSRLFLEQF